MTGWVGDIEEATLANTTFRTALFTGANLQLTVMRIAAGEEIGLEMHGDRDQFIRVEAGTARVTFGPSEHEVAATHEVGPDWAVIIPAGTWHNVVNTGGGDLQLYSLYAPPEHPEATVHPTKADADAAEAAHHG
ncbi:MAG TPA: cupin domain-containing protein [Acidimicrobiales bacterium]|jgi:mannose-6-phosphate isomerase-like protein (cupin superfamily)|nr:cupin domain-containing protein [Acidimicrobiales bacterium]